MLLNSRNDHVSLFFHPSRLENNFSAELNRNHILNRTKSTMYHIDSKSFCKTTIDRIELI